MAYRDKLKADILAKHGIGKTPHKRGRRLTRRRRSAPSKPRSKTSAMLLLEAAHNLPIEELLMAGNLFEVARRLGINFTTVSHWRLRLGLRETKRGRSY